MKVPLILSIIAMLMLSACSLGNNACIDDDFCSLDEQVRGTCNDCKPDFEPTDLSLSVQSSGTVSDTLAVGEARTYVVGGQEYEITAVFSSGNEVKFSVNGELTEALAEDDYTTLSGGVVITPNGISEDRAGFIFMAGGLPDTLRKGETKWYYIGGNNYEVTLVAVSDETTPQVVFSVNGELTKAMQKGEIVKLGNGLTIHVNDILVNPREGIASFLLTTDGVTLQYQYCIRNNGGPYNGRLLVNGYVGSDVDSEEEPFDMYVNFDKQILSGYFNVVQTANGIDVIQHTKPGRNDGNSYCTGGMRSVSKSANYYLTVQVDPQGEIAERTTGNNINSLSVPGEPVFFPNRLVEYSVGPYQYTGSRGTDRQKNSIFANGGGYYGANYINTVVDNGFSVDVYVPDVPADGETVFSSWWNDAQVMDTQYGPVKVYRSQFTDTETGKIQGVVSILYKGANGEIILSGFLWPVEKDFDPAQHELFVEYFTRYSGAKFVPDQCSTEAPFSCADFAWNGQSLEMALQNNAGAAVKDVTVKVGCGPIERGTLTLGGKAYLVSYSGTNIVHVQESDASLLTTYLKENVGSMVVGGVEYKVVLDPTTRVLRFQGATSTNEVVLTPANVASASSIEDGKAITAQYFCADDAPKCVTTERGSGESFSISTVCRITAPIEIQYKLPETSQSHLAKGEVSVTTLRAIAMS